MPDQLSMFDAGSQEPEPSLPYQAHSETSKAAAESMEISATSIRGKVWALFQGHPEGLIDEQIQKTLGTNTVGTARVRRIELVAMGLVRDSGRKRATSSGRMAVVWEVVPENER